MLDSATTRSRFDQLGHAIFLGCSWTWCIGMFLPILLWRDFGPWALAVFAIPNIVGAAAMGAVLSSPDQARWILRHHAAAIGVFRVSTVLFHYVFAFWLAHSMGVPQTQLIFGAVAFVLLTELFRSALRLSQASASLVVWLTSLAVGVILAVSGNIGPVPEGPPALPIGHLLPLALVCMLGFLLCPYLDPTFLVVRAQIEHPADARRTFALGFGVIFASMVALTAGYAWLFGPSASPAALRNAAPIAGAAVLIHLLVQAVFTIAAHNATRDQLPERHDWASTLRVVGIMLGAGLALGLAASYLPLGGLAGGEAIYRIMLGMYGLVFPAYVWLCMVPKRGVPLLPTRWNLSVLAITIVVASPAMWAGMILRHTWWLSAAVGVVLLARLVVKTVPAPGDREPPERSGAPVPSPRDPGSLAAAARAPESDRPDR